MTLLVIERGDSEVMNTGIYCRCLTVNSFVLEDVRRVAIEVKCTICSVELIRLLFWLSIESNVIYSCLVGDCVRHRTEQRGVETAFD